MLDNDIVLAQQIVSGKYSNYDDSKVYHDNSFIYKFSNEMISYYQKYLENRKKALIITASGDQILNSILSGTYDITSCDISRFPKYFFELKKAAILSLTKDEYFDFFLKDDCYDDILNDDLYDKIRENLKEENKEFWDGLFQFFEGGEIYNSQLFSHEIITPYTVISRNNYMKDDNYEKLQQQIKKANVNHKVGDIRDILLTDNNKYDLVNLSSIIYFYRGNYKELLKNINLNEKGIILSYLFDNKRKRKYEEIFFEEEFTLDYLTPNDCALVYKKVK